ncbi:MAG: glutaredoxin 3 [Armatimonadetes bacterium]|nr:glutaredoxin 3 [Armatimonadota bacterium]
MARIDLYSIEYCPFCSAARALLERKGLDYTHHDLSDLSDRDLRQKMLELAGRTTVPQIFINDRHIGGYTDLDALDRSGELDRLLQSSGD